MKSNKWPAMFLAFVSIEIAAQSLSDDTLHWSDYKKLSWADFGGDTIDVPGLTGQALMTMLADMKKLHLFLPASTRVTAVFDRRNSWATHQGRNVSSLRYYQVMFDLYEVYSRRLRKEFRTTRFGIDPNKVFMQKYNAALTDLSDRHKLYLKETRLGLDTSAVSRWDETLKKELRELEGFRSSR